MKKIIYSLLFAGCILMCASCNESLTETETSTSLISNTDIAFDVYGFQKVDLYDSYSSFDYDLTINSSETSAVSIVVDESILDDYNSLYDSEYELLSSDYYSFTGSVTLNGSSLEVPITFNVEKMLTELSYTEASNLVLPLTIEPSVDSLVVNETMCNALIHVNLSEATLILEQPELIELDDTMGLSTLSLSAYYNFEGIDDSKVSVSVDEDAVSDYNDENGTEYPVLPADSYTYTGLTKDTVNSKLTIAYEFDTEVLDDTTYVLPVIISSSEYATDSDTPIYCLVKITDSGLVFIGEYDLSTYQAVDNTYAYNELSFDLSEAADLYGVTVDELEEGLTFYAVNSNESTTESYTANTGYWYNSSGDACSWGATDCALFVEYAGDGILHVGQFPDYCQAWDVYTVSMAMVYNGDMIRYNVTLNVIPAYSATYDLSLNEDVDANYTVSTVTYDFAEVASTLGTTETDLSSDLVFYGVNADGSLVTSGYTANTGFWYDINGDVCSWGADDCALFVEYGGDGILNVGQFPEGMVSGDSVTVSLAIIYNDQLVKFNVTLNIN